MHARRTPLSKADYYTSHLFISTLCHAIEDSHAEGAFDRHAEGATYPPVLEGRRSTVSPRPTIDPKDSADPSQFASSSQTVTSVHDEHPNWLARHISRPEGDLEATHASPADDGVGWIIDSITGSEKDSKRDDPTVDSDLLHREVCYFICRRMAYR